MAGKDLENMLTLDDMFDLKDDYDGEGSLAPPKELIEEAFKYLKEFKIQPDRIVAGVNGTIHFEWNSDNYLQNFRKNDEIVSIELWWYNSDTYSELAMKHVGN